MPKKTYFYQNCHSDSRNLVFAYIATLLDRSIRKGSLGHYYLVYCKYKAAGGIF